MDGWKGLLKADPTDWLLGIDKMGKMGIQLSARKDNRGRTVAAGIYFCSMTAAGKTMNRKVVLAR